MAYLVIACKSCGTARIAPSKNETATCPRCGASTRLEDALVHARTEDAKTARHAIGQINAKQAGETYDQTPNPKPEPRDPIDRAIQPAREVTNQRRRAQLAAQGLTRELSTFTQDEWATALERLDIPRARALEHLARLQQANLVTEPTHGSYRHV